MAGGGGERLPVPVWALVLIVSVLGSTAVVVWRAAVLSEKLEQNTMATGELKALVTGLAIQVNALTTRTAVLEAQRPAATTSASHAAASP